MLVRGLLSSASTMCYVFFLMLLMLYLFANMAIELITKDWELRAAYPEFDQMVVEFFGDLFLTMMTLLQFATFDSCGEIYRNMIPYKPYTFGCFFLIFMLVVSLSMMNLVTAVIVEGSLEQASKDKEVNHAYKAAALKKMLPVIRDLFLAMDADKSGLIDISEVLKAPAEVQEELAKVMEMDDFVELFEILDVDSNGTLDVQEYVDGITKLVTSDTPLEQLRMQKSLNIVRQDLKELLLIHGTDRKSVTRPASVEDMQLSSSLRQRIASSNS